MKRVTLAVLSALILWCSAVVAQTPVVIAHHGTVASPANRLFHRLQSQFAGGWLGPYKVIRSDLKTKTLMVRRDSIDPENWAKWAYCKVGPLDMIDSLRDGSVTLTIALEPGRGVTYAAVSADFEGTYGLASSSKTVQCISTGSLEDSLLTTIAADDSQRPRRVARR